MADKTQSLANMNTRQKVTIGILVIVVIFIIYEIIGMFSAGKQPAPGITPTNQSVAAGGPNMQPGPAQMKPRPEAQLPQPQLSPEMAELMKLQQETQAKYLAALNELQMLKIAKEIADNNRDIMKSKLDAVSSEKEIVKALSTPEASASAYSQALVTPATAGAGPLNAAPAAPPQEISYLVVSVSELNNIWSAVLGAQGNLYSVHVGDVLPLDKSTVVTIDKSGVVLEKDGVRKKLSMVSVI